MSRRHFAGILAGTAGAAWVPAAGTPLPQFRQVERRVDPGAPVRVGMIGRTGHIGYVLDEIDTVPGARIVAYAFEDGAWSFNSDGTARPGPYDMGRNRRWLEGQPWTTADLRLYETYQEMLEKERLDLAVVALPYARNAFAVAAAARAGVNIFSEKPVAVTLADLDLVEAAVEKSGVRLSAMFGMRYSPNIFTVRETVLKGSIGRPCLARAQKSYKWGEERPWFYRDKGIYGSTILWVGIHAVDYVRWATGLEVRKVSGFHSNLAHPGFEGVQDTAVLSLELEGGASASITMDFLRPDTAPTHGDDRLRIAGSEGIVETIGEPATVTLLRRDQDPGSLGLVAPPRSMFADLVSELRGEGMHLIGPDEAVRVTRICIVATEAAETGRVLPV